MMQAPYSPADLAMTDFTHESSSLTAKAASTSLRETTPVVEHNESKNVRLRRKFYGCAVFLKSVGVSLLNFRFLNGDAEERKTVVDYSWKIALLRNSVHILPVMATITLTALTFKGHFIGANLEGSGDVEKDDIFKLALQITSKLIELLVLASLSRIILDIVRHETLRTKDGLPFGLLVASFEFKDISYLWSPSMVYGGKAMGSKLRRIWITGMIFISMLIATFIGPSSAFLVVPSMRTNWAAGGADFWLRGNETTLWPKSLDSLSAGGSHCLNASAELVIQAPINSSGCVWYSTATLTQTFQSSHFQSFANITVLDGYQRTIGMHPSTPSYPDTWAVSSNAIVGLLSVKLVDWWWEALGDAPICKKLLSPFRTYKYRVNEGTVMRVSSPIPVARTRCFYHPSLLYKQAQLEFPIMPEFSISPEDAFFVKVLPVKSASILTQWLPMPETTQVKTKKGGITGDYPTAFSFVQLPLPDDPLRVVGYACSVDARWVLGENISPNVVNDAYWSDHSQHGEMERLIVPVNDGKGTKIAANMDWLYALTPIVGNLTTSQTRETPAWTSYSSMLSSSGFSNDSSVILKWDDLAKPLESVLAALFVEGLARIGFTENSGSRIGFNTDSALGFPTSIPQFKSMLDSLLRDDGKAIPPPNSKPEQLTKLHWGIFISGYAYKADSTAHYLALTVLFTHLLLATGHFIWSVSTRLSSEAWSSVSDLVALSHSSEPDPRALKNTSAGIRCRETYKRKVKIRVGDGEDRGGNGGEQLQLLFDTTPDTRFSQVVNGDEYGSSNW